MNQLKKISNNMLHRNNFINPNKKNEDQKQKNCNGSSKLAAHNHSVINNTQFKNQICSSVKKQIKCPECNTKVADLLQHQQIFCPKRQAQCLKCGQVIFNNKLQAHVCQLKQVQQKNCSKQIQNLKPQQQLNRTQKRQMTTNKNSFQKSVQQPNIQQSRVLQSNNFCGKNSIGQTQIKNPIPNNISFEPNLQNQSAISQLKKCPDNDTEFFDQQDCLNQYCQEGFDDQNSRIFYQPQQSIWNNIDIKSKLSQDSPMQQFEFEEESKQTFNEEQQEEYDKKDDNNLNYIDYEEDEENLSEISHTSTLYNQNEELQFQPNNQSNQLNQESISPNTQLFMNLEQFLQQIEEINQVLQNGYDEQNRELIQEFYKDYYAQFADNIQENLNDLNEYEQSQMEFSEISEDKSEDGLDDSQIEQLGSFIFDSFETEQKKGDNSNLQDIQQNQCAICYSKFENGEAIRKIICKHMFHKECIDNWLKIKATCPLCRQNLKQE